MDTEETVEAIRGFANRKVNVNTHYEWSSYRRVSDNLQTGPAGGTISCTKSITFATEFSGNISGIGLSTGASVSTSVGYTLNVGPNKRVYMGYRVYYKVETGTNEFYDTLTGEVLTSTPYMIKIPQYGEYTLFNY